MKKYIRYFLIIFIISVMICPLHSKADSMDNSVASIDELYTEMSNQILQHISTKSYYLASDELVQMVSGKNTWDNFLYHYNPSKPLMSGCYAGYQIADGRISWFTTNKRTISITFKFLVPKDTMDAYFEETQALALQLKGENDFDSVKNVHDYLIDRVEYDHSSAGENYTDIEGFRENRMVCQGYSMATYVLLSYMNIPVRIVTGKGGPEGEQNPHAWNIVRIDGSWYNYDATWDDASNYGTDYTYFLKSNEDFPMHHPEGIYAVSDFTNMISTDSYPMGIGSANVYITFIIAAFLGILIGVLIIVIKSVITRKASATLSDTGFTPAGTVIEDDFDSFMQDNES